MKKEILIIGSTSFIGVNLCLSLIDNGFQVYGNLKWDFPHPVHASSQKNVTSKYEWYGVKSNYSIFGSAELDSSNSFDLVDPMNFRVELFENSKIVIEAGANILVSGTTIFKSNNGDIKKNIDLLKSL